MTDKSNFYKKRVSIILLILIGVIILCIIFIDNRNIVYENYIITDNKGSFSSAEIKIIQLSDMHFPKIKIDIEKLLKKLKKEKPDIIAITGDFIDQSAMINDCGAKNFIERIKPIAPIFYVNGNHEAYHKDAEILYDFLIANGVVILNNESINISLNNFRLTIIGITDNINYSSLFLKDNLEAKNNYKILLAHRPEKWLTYISASNTIKPNLVLSGHAHGGQLRLFDKGLYAPNQGWFPKYDSGLYVSDNGDVKMIVSRGLGNSVFPFRFNNKPHIPIITLTI